MYLISQEPSSSEHTISMLQFNAFFIVWTKTIKKKKRRVWARVDRRCIFIWSDNVSCVKLNALCSCHAHLLRIVKHWELCCIINCWTRFLIKKKVNIDIHCLLKKSIVLVARHTKTYYLCLPTLRWTALEQQGNECNACYCLSQFLFAAFFFFLSSDMGGVCCLLPSPF